MSEHRIRAQLRPVEAWPSVRLKHIARLAYGDSLSAEQRTDGDALVYGSNGVVGTHGAKNMLAPAIVVGRKGSFGKVTYAKDGGFAIDTTYYVDARTTREDLRWLYFVLTTLRLDENSQDTGVPGLSREYAYELRLALPPAASQRTIADYLDRKTAAIDALIANKRKLLDLLAEKRSALINQAVTGGDECLGRRLLENGLQAEAAQDWRILKFPWVIDFQEGPGILSKDFAQADSGIPLLRIASVQSDPATLTGCNWLDETTVRLRWAHMTVEEGDIVISGSASTELVSEIDSTTAGAVLYTGLIRLRPKAEVLLPGYIKLWVRSRAFQDQVDLLKAGATIQHFGPTHLRQTFIAVPPLHYQRAAIDSCDRGLRKLSEAYESIMHQLDRLQEYRQALITAAVTGQLDLGTGEDTPSAGAAREALEALA